MPTLPTLPNLPAVTLVLGGARSGKSAYAEALVAAHGPAIYLATAEARDAEMAARIDDHKARRGDTWETIEEPLDLIGVLQKSPADRPVLIECLTLWLSNILEAGRDADAEGRALVDALGGRAAPLVLVANEVGLGIVPDNASARAFADAAGRLNQAVAGAADRVVFIAAGQPLVLKSGAG